MQDRTALQVVALLIDCETGYVANANICHVDATDYVASVPSITAPTPALPSACYDLTGRRVATPTHGIYIKDGRKVVM